MMQEVIPRYQPPARKRVNPYRVAMRALWTVLLLAVTAVSVLSLSAAIENGGAGTNMDKIIVIFAIFSTIIAVCGWASFISSIFTLLSNKAKEWEGNNGR